MVYLMVVVLLLCVIGTWVVYFSEVVGTLKRHGEDELAAKGANGAYFIRCLARYTDIKRNRLRQFPTGTVIVALLQMLALSIGIALFRGLPG